jgi:hypothetical protein
MLGIEDLECLLSGGAESRRIHSACPHTGRITIKHGLQVMFTISGFDRLEQAVK